MDPLIITAACGYTRPPGASDAPETVASIVAAVEQAARAGAAIAQIRAPHRIDPQSGRPMTDLKTWIELVRQIRERCDILVHAGVAAMPIEQRIELFEMVRPDIASFLLGNHSIVVRGMELNSLRTRADALRLFQDDPLTAAIVLIGEIGGSAEEEAARFIRAHVTKPVVGYIAGRTAPPGKRMGHAGAVISGSEGTAGAKVEALRAAGVRVATLPGEVANLVAEVL